MPQHWLMKSEPDEASVDHFAAAPGQTLPWTGVRNFQARNFMRAMNIGDGVLFYHSSTAIPGIYGIAEVASAAYPDPTQFDPRSKYHDEKSSREDPRWSLVDVRHVRTLAHPITLEAIRGHADALGEDFALIRRGTRLSVLPVTPAQWKLLLSLE